MPPAIHSILPLIHFSSLLFISEQDKKWKVCAGVLLFHLITSLVCRATQSHCRVPCVPPFAHSDTQCLSAKCSLLLSHGPPPVVIAISVATRPFWTKIPLNAFHYQTTEMGRHRIEPDQFLWSKLLCTWAGMALDLHYIGAEDEDVGKETWEVVVSGWRVGWK